MKCLTYLGQCVRAASGLVVGTYACLNTMKARIKTSCSVIMSIESVFLRISPSYPPTLEAHTSERHGWDETMANYFHGNFVSRALNGLCQQCWSNDKHTHTHGQLDNTQAHSPVELSAFNICGFDPVRLYGIKLHELYYLLSLTSGRIPFRSIHNEPQMGRRARNRNEGSYQAVIFLRI